jgi:hypothetical protein
LPDCELKHHPNSSNEISCPSSNITSNVSSQFSTFRKKLATAEELILKIRGRAIDEENDDSK